MTSNPHTVVRRYFAKYGPTTAKQAAEDLGIQVRLVQDYVALAMAEKRFDDNENMEDL